VLCRVFVACFSGVKTLPLALCIADFENPKNKPYYVYFLVLVKNTDMGEGVALWDFYCVLAGFFGKHGMAELKFAPCEHLCKQYSFNLVSSGW
jgi:hypothetical protein